jgi:hypothetical protein
LIRISFLLLLAADPAGLMHVPFPFIIDPPVFRVIDGADDARFMNDLIELIENPKKLDLTPKLVTDFRFMRSNPLSHPYNPLF